MINYKNLGTWTSSWSKYFWCPSQCLKSVRIRSISGPYFPAFRLKTEIIQTNTNTFYSVAVCYPLIRQSEGHLVRNIGRSSCLEVFCRKSVLRNFAKFIRKHLCHNVFFNKVAGQAFFHRTPPVAASVSVNVSVNCF